MVFQFLLFKLWAQFLPKNRTVWAGKANAKLMLNRTKMQLTVIIFPWLQLFGVLQTARAHIARPSQHKRVKNFSIFAIFMKKYEKLWYEQGKNKSIGLDFEYHCIALHRRQLNKGEYLRYVIPGWHYSAAAIGHDFSYWILQKNAQYILTRQFIGMQCWTMMYDVNILNWTNFLLFPWKGQC